MGISIDDESRVGLHAIVDRTKCGKAIWFSAARGVTASGSLVSRIIVRADVCSSPPALQTPVDQNECNRENTIVRAFETLVGHPLCHVDHVVSTDALI